jgi:hypothetical protein
MGGELTRGKLAVALAAGAVAFGAAAWLLLGPVWIIAGVLVGALVGAFVLAGIYALASIAAAALLGHDRPDWLADLELLADALAAVHEATDICQDKLPWQQVPSCAARAMLLEGDLLCGQARHREAARLLAKGWRLAAGQQDVRRDATPAIRAAHHADPDHFSAVWQAETGAEPPDWLST